mgnify:CR=1 FL=1
MSDKHGLKLTEEEAHGMESIFMILSLARMKPFTTKSGMAREAATEIALCASEGFLTTQLNPTTFGNVWLVTQLGLEYLEEMEDVFGV